MKIKLMILSICFIVIGMGGTMVLQAKTIPTNQNNGAKHILQSISQTTINTCVNNHMNCNGSCVNQDVTPNIEQSKAQLNECMGGHINCNDRCINNGVGNTTYSQSTHASNDHYANRNEGQHQRHRSAHY